MTDDNVVMSALIGVAVALLLVGVVSGTILRHVIQVAPVVLAALTAFTGQPWSRCAAIPVFLFWFFIMLLIWLYLLGIANVITGHFSTAEIALTVVVGISAAAGLVRALVPGKKVAAWPAAATFLVFVGLQVGAMCLSLQPAFATR